MKRYGFLIFMLWSSSTLFLASGIDIRESSYPAGDAINDQPFYMKILGESKSVVSNLSLLEADLYFHGGVGHFLESHKEGVAIGAMESSSGDHFTGQEEDTHHHDEDDTSPSAGKFNILMKLSEKVRITKHIHLKRNEIKEMIPWIYYAAKIDPNNVMAYTLGAYWLIDRMGKLDEGLSFLREGYSHNPGSWEIMAELGRVYYIHLKDYRSAIVALNNAYINLRDADHDKFDERYVLSLMAFSYEAVGNKKEALPIYLYLKKLFPADKNIIRKISELTA